MLRNENPRRSPQSGHTARVLALLLLFMVMISAATTLSHASQLAQITPSNLIDVRVNQTTTADQQEPTLAVDPTNPNNILAGAKDWRTGPKQVWHYRSTDGGRTWADSYANLLPSELPNQSDPVVAFDASGAAYTAVLGYNQNDFSVGGVFVARSTDIGATWQRATLVSANADGIFNDKEWLTIDRSANQATRGSIYVTWTLFTEVSPNKELARIVLSRSTDAGKTFSPRQAISPSDQDSVQGSFPVVGPKGELYVLYFSSPGAALEEKEQERGNGDAAGRTQSVVNQVMQANEEDALFIVKSTDGGTTFGKPVKVATVSRPRSPLPGSQFRMFVLPTLAVDPNNSALYATWNDFAAGNSDTLLVTSKDAGATWTTPTRVNDDPTSSRADQFFPTAVVGADSVLHVYWLDRRDDAANLLYRPYYSRSTDGGKSFSKNMPLSARMSNPDIGFEGTLIGDYIALDVSGDGSRFYAAWIDTQNGDQDIYFTTLDTASSPTELPATTPLPRGTPAAVPSPQPLTGFSARGFITAWERADRAVLTGKAQRPWVWGPAGFAAAEEPYKQGINGLRDVLYFDKARMEINDPRLDPEAPGFVTNGLLVVELISGRVQLGNGEFDRPRAPSDAPVAGDGTSPDALTYASLAPVASLNNDNRATDNTGQSVTASLNRAGQIVDDPNMRNLVKIVRYEPTLGHNIPDVFWTFMNANGPIYNGRFDTYSNGKVLDWVSTLGYPITEPYWTRVNIGTVQKSVLVQAFQRRVLTYVADNPPGWQVEMGNVGRHYFDWRYGSASKK